MISLGVATQGAAWLGVSGRSLAGFSPDKLPSFAQWFDPFVATSYLTATGGSPVADGGTVGAIKDLIGTNDAFQNTAGARPLYDADGLNGRPCLALNGSRSIAHNYSRGGTNQPLTVYVVANVTSGSGFRGIYATNGDGSANELMMLASTSSAPWGTYGGAVRSANSTIVGTGAHLFCMVRTGAGGDFFLDNVADGSFAATSGQFGVIGGVTDQQMTGFIGEILVYGAAHGPTERAKIYDYIKPKWGTP